MTVESSATHECDVLVVGSGAASIMGGDYPGAGITLGSALTLGYIAGRHIADRVAKGPPA